MCFRLRKIIIGSKGFIVFMVYIFLFKFVVKRGRGCIFFRFIIVNFLLVMFLLIKVNLWNNDVKIKNNL